ncbi:MAG TPA: GatB/YqeY domain-containing protein [Polyangiales bacterium]|nr:GatB/YqeY domain-containing protein [Polyangiales bacterium]
MSIKDKISEDLKAAMRAKDSVRLDAIRSVRAAITLREVEKQRELNDDEVIEVVRSLRKQKLESIEMFQSGGRADLVERETREKEVLESYLPQAPTREAVEQTVAQIISELGASSVKDMGRVMQASKERLSGADGKLLSEVVRAQLAK